jgi:hypothetical protein
MSTLVVAAVLVGIVAAVIFLLVSIDKKQKRNAMNQLLHAFSQKGSEHGLTFSGQEILKETVIGLDGVQRKMLVLQRRDEKAFDSFIIDLNEVKGCTVKKEHGKINLVEFRAGKQEQYLEKIALRFELQGKPPVEVLFYQHFANHIYEIAELESKAKHWEVILSKMVVPVKKIA